MGENTDGLNCQSTDIGQRYAQTLCEIGCTAQLGQLCNGANVSCAPGLTCTLGNSGWRCATTQLLPLGSPCYSTSQCEPVPGKKITCHNGCRGVGCPQRTCREVVRNGVCYTDDQCPDNQYCPATQYATCQDR